MRHILRTGQNRCYNAKGHEISCAGSGQDGAFLAGTAWPEERFQADGLIVHDRLTNLSWTLDANINQFPCTWQEALDLIAKLNSERYGGHNDWRLPNRNEMRSLMGYQSKKPALPEHHPFENVFLGWYWTSTTAAIHPGYAWSVHLEGARMFYGKKSQYQLFWPVRGEGNNTLPVTGQTTCYDTFGRKIQCSGFGQDGAIRHGVSWPDPRFTLESEIVHDRLTGLGWAPVGNVTRTTVCWQEALDAVRMANKHRMYGIDCWRLPNINELASLVDSSCHTPALPEDHPFTGMQDGYWSSTTSYFETDWAWVLYLNKGACGVGYKPDKTFYVWMATTLKQG